MTTELIDYRNLALYVGFMAIEDEYKSKGMGYDSYVEAFEGWDVKGIARDGLCIGATYTKDGELHVAINPEWHGRWVTRSLLNAMFDMPKVIARPIPRGEAMYDYLTRLGFVDVGDDTLVKES